jgi:hypothetical protein
MCFCHFQACFALTVHFIILILLPGQGWVAPASLLYQGKSVFVCVCVCVCVCIYSLNRETRKNLLFCSVLFC